jgi:hypothetical protein
MRRFNVEIKKGRFKIQGLLQIIGDDILLSIWGGTRSHIGSIALAQPRPSLRDPKKWSATSSNLTLLGHKEDIIVKRISEKLASKLRRNVVVTAGLHWDNLTLKEIKQIENISLKISDEVLKRISPIEVFETKPSYYRRGKNEEFK